jgi:hypothetical protein
MIDPNDYWVNNPLITPINKALMYDNDIDGAISSERQRIIELLEVESRIFVGSLVEPNLFIEAIRGTL